jgi:hypothetical protein
VRAAIVSAVAGQADSRCDWAARSGKEAPFTVKVGSHGREARVWYVCQMLSGAVSALPAGRCQEPPAAHSMLLFGKDATSSGV